MENVGDNGFAAADPHADRAVVSHTSGPWFINTNGAEAWSVDYDGPSSSYVTITGARKAPIAFAVEPSAYGTAVDANARLISAAPDLLEALNLYDFWLKLPQDRGGGTGPMGLALAAFIAAKNAAIAKAVAQ